MRLRNPTQGRCALCLNAKETEVVLAESETGGFKPMHVCKDHAFILAKAEPPYQSKSEPESPVKNDSGEQQ